MLQRKKRSECNHVCRRQRSGFTLIEVLVATGIVGIVIVILVQSFLTSARSSTKTQLISEVKQNGDYALGIMERMIRNAVDVSAGSCDGGTPVRSITITNPDNGITKFDCDDAGIPRIASESGTDFSNIQYLTGSNVTLGSACPQMFTCESSASQIPTAVTIQFALKQVSSSGQTFETSSIPFQTRVTIRNTVR